ncbi:M-phase inducer phosphatase [Daldinia childiae]|uniref:M-phase inducer phosphatase n=1 Tax=Daldinia childiae TaxID=326645 RepID=UPI0014482108|nr:M-phase inducer phosphatase [Daldinia childiae]KAF3066521.1 M-phase inducer phosphatase [Daldinia childiae]
MDASSPLAAMRPTPTPAWGQQSRHYLPSRNPFGSGNIAIREQLHRSNPDYFNSTIRGSSPAASLAADLSQNFRIDSEDSPRFPTPRRALFTSNMMEAIENRGYVTTPPLPVTSSPLGGYDAMDISPLPNKEPFFSSFEVASPTPQGTPGDDVMMESPIPVTRQSSMGLEPSKVLFEGTVAESEEDYADPLYLELRATLPALFSLRSCIQKTKFLLFALGPNRQQCLLATVSTTLPFKIGDPLRRIALPLAMLAVLGPRLSSQHLTGLEIFAQAQVPLFLVTFVGCQIHLHDLVGNGKFNDVYTQKMVIDCRFEYEYEGGHIDAAINYNDKELLAKHLFENPMHGKTLLIFHCEYSACRAPMMARHIRASDRMVNAEYYPRLTYPEVYILEGGYSEFFIENRERCYPQAYVEMGAEEHARTCERELGKLQQKRKGLGRAKTFAFGHRESMVEASPTAPERRYEHPSPVMMIGNSPILGNNRSPARRMASF